MKIILLALLCLVLAPIPLSASYDTPTLLHAIAEVETGLRGNLVGRHGERTMFQIKPSTWRQYSSVPITRASHAEVCRVATAILSDITRSLERSGIPVTPYSVALRWNAGTNARRYSRHSVDYARRVTNLYSVAVPDQMFAVTHVTGMGLH
jgi:hypothetical protein